MHDMLKFGILADDLTGANDTGIQFHHAGFRTTVTLHQDNHVMPPPKCDAWVLDVGSRGMGQNEAYEKTLLAANLMRSFMPEVIYKKIDSTIRGNIGAECSAIMDAMDHYPFAMIAPAMPRLGRTTQGGLQYLHQVPIHETELSRDPLSPITTSSIKDILTVQTDRRIGNIQLSALDDFSTFSQQLLSLIKKGCTLIVVDALSEQDLINIVRYTRCSGVEPVWVGSAGLAHALTTERTSLQENTNLEDSEGKHTADKDILLVSGSKTELNNKQIQYVKDRMHVPVYEVTAGDLMKGGQSLERIVAEAAEIYRSKGILLFSIEREPENPECIVPNETQGNRDAYFSRMLIKSVAQAVCAILTDNTRTGWLVVIGGETARTVCESLGATSIELYDELMPGVPHGRLIDGHSMHLVTKSGSFGQEDTLAEIIKRIR